MDSGDTSSVGSVTVSWARHALNHNERTEQEAKVGISLDKSTPLETFVDSDGAEAQRNKVHRRNSSDSGAIRFAASVYCSKVDAVKSPLLKSLADRTGHWARH